MRRPRILFVAFWLALVAALLGPQLASAAPGPAVGQNGQVNKIMAHGAVPNDVQQAANQGNVYAQAAQKYWQEGGEVVVLPDGSFVIPVRESWTSPSPTSSPNTTLAAPSTTTSSSDTFLGTGIWLVNPVTGMNGVQAVVDPTAFSTYAAGVTRYATVALANFDYSRTFTWSFVPGNGGNVLNELNLQLTYADGTVFQRVYVISGSDNTDLTTPRYLKIAKSTNYPMSPQYWNIYYGRGANDVAPVDYNLYWFTTLGTGTATALDASDPLYGQGHLSNIQFLTKNGWVLQTAKKASSTHFFNGSNALTPTMNHPYYDWSVK